jgi:hypothetical protein
VQTYGPLENGYLIVTDASGPGLVSVDPDGDGITVTRSYTVNDGDQFTITVDPYTEADGTFIGSTGAVDVSLAIDARVTVTQ